MIFVIAFYKSTSSIFFCYLISFLLGIVDGIYGYLLNELVQLSSQKDNFCYSIGQTISPIIVFMSLIMKLQKLLFYLKK